MTCDQARSLMSAALDGALSSAEREAVNAHVRACAACHSHWQTMSRVTALFASAGQAEPPAGFSLRVMAAVTAGRQASVSAPPRSALSGLAWVGAAAAVTLTWVGLWALCLSQAASRMPASSVVELSMRVSAAALAVSRSVDALVAMPLRLAAALPAPILILAALWVVAGTAALGLTVGSLVAAYQPGRVHDA